MNLVFWLLVSWSAGSVSVQVHKTLGAANDICAQDAWVKGSQDRCKVYKVTLLPSVPDSLKGGITVQLQPRSSQDQSIVVEGVAKRKSPVNRFQKDSDIAQLQVLIADPDTDENAREEAYLRVLELRLEKQEEALSRFMRIK